MSSQRRWRRVVLAATPAAALISLVSTGCGPAAPATPTRAAPLEQASAIRAASGAPRPTANRRLAETATEKIRPDGPLPSSRSSTAVAPVQLQAPRVGIDTRLVRLGLRSDGTIAVPASAAVAGWYTGGPAPGQVGPAVLAGHIDSHTGPGVFFRLAELRTGDPVVVRRADGRAVRFTVTGVQRFAKSAFPTAEVYGPTPFPELRLVTCAGMYDAKARHYRDNVVVFARQLG